MNSCSHLINIHHRVPLTPNVIVRGRRKAPLNVDTSKNGDFAGWGA